MTLRQEIDLRVINEKLKDLAEDVVALVSHAESALDIRVPTRPLGTVVAPSTASRLSMLVAAVSLLRCVNCGKLASHGNCCQACFEVKR